MSILLSQRREQAVAAGAVSVHVSALTVTCVTIHACGHVPYTCVLCASATGNTCSQQVGPGAMELSGGLAGVR